jgi:RNA polymerase sigma factor (sigma-70 family)
MTEEQKNLIESNIRFVHHIIQNYKKTGIAYDELTSAGYFAITKAAKTFNPNSGHKFITYAGICIHNEISTLLKRHNKRRKIMSLDTPIISDGNGNESTIADLYDTGDRVEEDVLQRSEIEERKFIIGLYLINKSPRYANIIRLRLQNKTHDRIAKEIGISKSYISRILTKIEKELTALKNKIDRTNGEYIKRYSSSEIERAKRVLSVPECWVIQIERSCFDIPATKNKSVHEFSPSVNFLKKGLCFNSDMINLIDPDSEKLDIMFTRTGDKEGVLVFKFLSDASYFLKKHKSSRAYIESAHLTEWIFQQGIQPRKYSTCFYDEAEKILYVKVDCALIETKAQGDMENEN